MLRLPFAQIDAFAEQRFSGNPAAVIPLERWPSDTVLQAIAEENNLSETAYIVPASVDDVDADFSLRWFTPTAEVALCGHATLAAGHYVLSADKARGQVRFRTTQSGILSVSREGEEYALALPAWAPAAKPLPGVIAALGINRPAQSFWHERGYALIIVETEAMVRLLQPDMRALEAQGPMVVIVSARGTQADIVSRVFVPAYGVDEDPVTGSAHAVMVPYWANVLERRTFSAFQASKRGGKLRCTLDKDKAILSGKCVTVIEGEFLL